MSETNLPKPLSAYVGFIVASIEEARAASSSTAGQVARLPLAVAGQLLTVRHRYDEFARTGEDVVDLVVGIVRNRFGPGADEASGWVGDEFSTARGKAQAAVAVYTEMAGQVTGRLTGVAGKAASTVTSLAGSRSNGSSSQLAENVTGRIASTLERTAERVEEAAENAAPDAPPVAAEQELTPLQQIEEFEPPAELQAEAGDIVSHDELPLPDFDHMTAPQLRGRLRKLDQVSLVQLLDYERAHANRLQIVLMLENRLNKLIESGDDSGTGSSA